MPSSFQKKFWIPKLAVVEMRQCARDLNSKPNWASLAQAIRVQAGEDLQTARDLFLRNRKPGELSGSDTVSVGWCSASPSLHMSAQFSKFEHKQL